MTLLESPQRVTLYVPYMVSGEAIRMKGQNRKCIVNLFQARAGPRNEGEVVVLLFNESKGTLLFNNWALSLGGKERNVLKIISIT